MIEFLAFLGVLTIIYVIGFAITLIICRKEWMGMLVAFLWPLILIGVILDKVRK